MKYIKKGSDACATLDNTTYGNAYAMAHATDQQPEYRCNNE